jgi:hypothetical protein
MHHVIVTPDCLGSLANLARQKAGHQLVIGTTLLEDDRNYRGKVIPDAIKNLENRGLLRILEIEHPEVHLSHREMKKKHPELVRLATRRAVALGDRQRAIHEAILKDALYVKAVTAKLAVERGNVSAVVREDPAREWFSDETWGIPPTYDDLIEAAFEEELAYMKLYAVAVLPKPRFREWATVEPEYSTIAEVERKTEKWRLIKGLVISVAVVLLVSLVSVPWRVTISEAYLRSVSTIGPLMPKWLVFLGVAAIGYGLFRLRQAHQAVYGLLEVMFGIITANYAWPNFYQTSSVGSIAALLGSLYVIVRGLDNIDKSLKHPDLRRAWKSVFPKSS